MGCSTSVDSPPHTAGSHEPSRKPHRSSAPTGNTTGSDTTSPRRARSKSQPSAQQWEHFDFDELASGGVASHAGDSPSGTGPSVHPPGDFEDAFSYADFMNNSASTGSRGASSSTGAGSAMQQAMSIPVAVTTERVDNRGQATSNVAEQDTYRRITARNEQPTTTRPVPVKNEKQRVHQPAAAQNPLSPVTPQPTGTRRDPAEDNGDGDEDYSYSYEYEEEDEEEEDEEESADEQPPPPAVAMASPIGKLSPSVEIANPLSPASSTRRDRVANASSNSASFNSGPVRSGTGEANLSSLRVSIRSDTLPSSINSETAAVIMMGDTLPMRPNPCTSTSPGAADARKNSVTATAGVGSRRTSSNNPQSSAGTGGSPQTRTGSVSMGSNPAVLWAPMGLGSEEQQQPLSPLTPHTVSAAWKQPAFVAPGVGSGAEGIGASLLQSGSSHSLPSVASSSAGQLTGANVATPGGPVGYSLEQLAEVSGGGQSFLLTCPSELSGSLNSSGPPLGEGLSPSISPSAAAVVTPTTHGLLNSVAASDFVVSAPTSCTSTLHPIGLSPKGSLSDFPNYGETPPSSSNVTPLHANIPEATAELPVELNPQQASDTVHSPSSPTPTSPKTSAGVMQGPADPEAMGGTSVLRGRAGPEHLYHQQHQQLAGPFPPMAPPSIPHIPPPPPGYAIVFIQANGMFYPAYHPVAVPQHPQYAPPAGAGIYYTHPGAQSFPAQQPVAAQLRDDTSCSSSEHKPASATTATPREEREGPPKPPTGRGGYDASPANHSSAVLGYHPTLSGGAGHGHSVQSQSLSLGEATPRRCATFFPEEVGGAHPMYPPPPLAGVNTSPLSQGKSSPSYSNVSPHLRVPFPTTPTSPAVANDSMTVDPTQQLHRSFGAPSTPGTPGGYPQSPGHVPFSEDAMREFEDLDRERLYSVAYVAEEPQSARWWEQEMAKQTTKSQSFRNKIDLARDEIKMQELRLRLDEEGLDVDPKVFDAVQSWASNVATPQTQAKK